MSLRATNVAEETEEYREWARAVRTQSPPSSMDEYLRGWEAFFDHYASQVEYWSERNRGYHAAIAGLARYYVPKGVRVLEVGSGNGDLLAALEPSQGVGVDLSGEMVRLAADKYPHLRFQQMSAERLELPGEEFDVVLLSDLIGYSYDIRLVFERLQSVCSPRTRVIVNWYSRLWQPLLAALERLRLKYPQPMLNWTTVDDIRNLLHLADFKVVHHRGHILVPKHVPGLSGFANRYLAHLPGLRAFCLTELGGGAAGAVGRRRAGAADLGDLPVPQRGGQHRARRRTLARDGFPYGADLRRGSLARRHAGTLPRGRGDAPRQGHQGLRTGRRGQGRCRAPRLRQGER